MSEPETVDPVQWIMSQQWEAQQQGILSLWSIYDHPKDFPDDFVARMFHVDKSGSHPTNKLMVGPSLNQLRATMQRAGLTCLTRNKEDPPQIVETWL
jgi:hypothetical protein